MDEPDDDALWADVLDDDAWYDAERYWRAEVERLAAEAGQAGEWPSWEPKTYGDGVTPLERTFRAVCEGRSNKLDRAFRIYQHKVADEPPAIAAWVKDYEHDELWIEDEWPRLPKTMLVINLTFSGETADVARSLLRRWMRRETSAANMAAFISGTPAGG